MDLEEGHTKCKVKTMSFISFSAARDLNIEPTRMKKNTRSPERRGTTLTIHEYSTRNEVEYKRPSHEEPSLGFQQRVP